MIRSNSNENKNLAKNIVESKVFSYFILILIVINAATLGAETFDLSENVLFIMDIINGICMTIFIIEIALKLIAYRKSFFSDGWNIFDVIVIALSILPNVMFLSSTRILRVLRVFKVFRATRLIGHVKKLQNIIQALINAIPSIGWTVFILVITYYIYAVIGTNLFKNIAPDYFSDLWTSFYTLFQLTMADDIGEITRPVIMSDTAAVIYFISFMIIAVLLLLNLVIGVVVNSIEETRQQNKRKERLKTALELEIELDRLEEQMTLVKKLIEKERYVKLENVMYKDTMKGEEVIKNE